MRRSKAEVYLHMVWAVRQREPHITSAVERAIHRCIGEEARRLGCDVLAIGGMPDHVHLVVKAPTALSAATLAHGVKGVSSHFAHERLQGVEHLRWQEGYGVYSICRSHVHAVVEYVRGQREHHASGRLWASLEETDEEAPVAPEPSPAE